MNSKFRDGTNFNFSQTQSVKFSSNDENRYELKTDYHNSGEIEIYSNQSVNKINLNSKKVYLHGIFSVDWFQLACDRKATIGNSENHTTIKSLWSRPLIAALYLNLNNCTIQNDNESSDISIRFFKLTGKDFIIK